jgi:hypothetical protein
VEKECPVEFDDSQDIRKHIHQNSLTAIIGVWAKNTGR